VFIVDDEAPARRRLRELLDDVAAQLPSQVVGEAGSGAEALAALESVVADVVLLDIRMPGMDGIEVARRLAEFVTAPTVIFVTAFDAHAVAAFEVQARDYLLKPVRRERLVEALHKVVPVSTEEDGAPRITVNDRGRVLRVGLEAVLYLRAELKYVTLRTREREYVLDGALVKYEEDYPEQLLRLHRNCLVNRAHLAGFEQQREGEESHWVAILKDWPERLPVSRRQAHVIRDFRNGH
jgi:two-component system response regulator AlgR